MARLLVQLVGVFGFWIALMPLAAHLGASPAGAARLACAGAGLTLLGYGLLPPRRAPDTVTPPVTSADEGAQRPSA